MPRGLLLVIDTPLRSHQAIQNAGDPVCAVPGWMHRSSRNSASQRIPDAQMLAGRIR